MIRPRAPDPPPPSLDELIRRLQRLRPCWQEPERFFEARSELVHDLRSIARDGSSGAPGRPAGPPPHVQRLAALARAQQARIGRLELLLAQAAQARPKHRRRAPDDRQLVLSFTTERTA